MSQRLPPARVLLPSGPMPAPAALGSVMHKLAGCTMGTTWQVIVVGPRRLAVNGLRVGIERVLESISAEMSAWIPGSDLERFGLAEAGTWVPLPTAFAKVMRCALLVSERSGGAYDPSVASLVDAWGFGPRGGWDHPGFMPPPAEVLTALPIGWSALRLDDEDRLLQPGGWSLDLNAIAKGYAVDAVAEWLGQAGWSHHLVEIGGELRGVGLKPDGQPWWVAVELPSHECSLAPTRIGLSGVDGLSIATSGNYRRRYRFAGLDCSHTIDPRSRRPVAHGLASVTIVHERCLWADAWATALMVLGPSAGLALAEAEGLAALLQWRDAQGCWAEAASPALRDMLS